VGDPAWCPVLRPTRAEFSRPFVQYVEEAFKAHPDAPMLKVVPPKGWTPRTEPFPSLDSVRISTPIKQHVFGTKGAYRCLLEEQRGLAVADFKKLAYRDDHHPPRKGHKEDALLERAFWSSITLSPPFYGADTPCSFFDEHLRFGWNLRSLKCLLSHHDMPDIPGVTTPMTYFGMWKSFFSWHIEDVDLYSINYLHFGAPKVWYSVAPGDRKKFENMAGQLFPELVRNCKAFLRHKDILISPRVLRAFNVPFQQARQEAGEFVVLNAAAYHSGFNQGFNCAEAVNFALTDWLPLGRKATRCTCSALDEAVRLNMSMFRPEGEVWSEEEDSSDEETDSQEDDSDDSGSDSQLGSDEESSSAEGTSGSEEEEEGDSDSGASSQTNASEGHATGAGSGSAAAARRASGGTASTSGRGRKSASKASPASKSRPRKQREKRPTAKAAAARRGEGGSPEILDGVDMNALNAMMPRKMGRPFKRAENAARASAKIVAHAAAVVAEAEADIRRKHRPLKIYENERAANEKRAMALADAQAKLRQAKKFAAAACAAAVQAAAYRASHPDSGKTKERRAAAKRSRPAAGLSASPQQPAAKRSAGSSRSGLSGSGRVRKPSAVIRAGEDPLGRSRRVAANDKRRAAAAAVAARHAAALATVRDDHDEEWAHDQQDNPMVIVGQDPAAATKYFYMVQKAPGTTTTADGIVQLHWLAEGKDGLYRRTAGIYQEKLGALIPVQTQWQPRRSRREAGYKLLTPRSLILDTQLID